MNETRVNLKHLLENIRDSYNAPLEEVILTEMIANALDSRANIISFEVATDRGYIRCSDNGNGMKRQMLKNYHNIAASNKIRGVGIGFAGVGAKLALLIAEKVITESKGGHGSQAATEWRLTGPFRAPWKFLPFSGSVSSPRGTSVSIHLSENQSPLLRTEFVRETILKHFYPLLNHKIMADLLKYFYKKPVEFFVNGESVIAPENNQEELLHWFYIRQGRSRALAGIGYLTKTFSQLNWLEKILGKNELLTALKPGLYISTFGKVIKGGWEWLGLMPKNNEALAGIVEIPALAEILTTNKNDFLTTAAALKKYYKYRKSVQKAVLPLLEALGESRTRSQGYEQEKIIKPLNKSIDRALNNLVGDFPELESLLGKKLKETIGKSGANTKEEMSPRTESGEKNNEKVIKNNSRQELNTLPRGKEKDNATKPVKARQSGIQIVLEEIEDAREEILGKILDDILTVNTRHSAWQKAKTEGLEEYHILLTVALTLSEFLEAEKSPQEFTSRFLAAWANENPKNEDRLF